MLCARMWTGGYQYVSILIMLTLERLLACREGCSAQQSFCASEACTLPDSGPAAKIWEDGMHIKQSNIVFLV